MVPLDSDQPERLLRPGTPPGWVSTPAVGHDTITNSVLVATVRFE
jgi:hypothetical protein